MTLATDERHLARERALTLLYEAESKGQDAAGVLADQSLVQPALVSGLVLGVERERERIDALITRLAIGWPLERMAAIDRSVLRLAVFELIERTDVPVAVVIDEAVELVKQYSTEDSGRFVNGVLAAAARELRPAPDL